jgi:hypothetical protein
VLQAWYRSGIGKGHYEEIIDFIRFEISNPEFREAGDVGSQLLILKIASGRTDVRVFELQLSKRFLQLGASSEGNIPHVICVGCASGRTKQR